MSQESRRALAHELMDRLGLSALVLRQPANFAWYTNGADNRIDHASPVGVADMVITRDTEVVLTNNIEAQRMRDEQVPQFEVVEYPWFEEPTSLLREVAGTQSLGSDSEMENSVQVANEIAPLRWTLDEEAIARYPDVGADAAAAMQEAASAIEPGMTEIEAAGLVAGAARRRGLYTPVILAAADDRIRRVRHPLPTSGKVEKRIMLVLCGERGGLFANLTHFVNFEHLEPDLERHFEACENILRRMREEATQPGRTLAEAFEDCRRFYAEEGFPDEWKLHHQGGSTGYRSREVIATPATNVVIEAGQAFAWNPSITGAKAEETFLLSETGPVILARG